MSSRRHFLGGAGAIAAAVSAATVSRVAMAALPEPVLQDKPDTMPPLVPNTGRPYNPVVTLNGYGTARTFDLRKGRPFLSYDYYLDVKRPVEEAAADLDELIQLNPQRPYFLLMHVRESNTVEKVADIFSRLSEKVEVVPLDVFLKLAASKKTYRTNFQKPTDPIDRNP